MEKDKYILQRGKYDTDGNLITNPIKMKEDYLINELRYYLRKTKLVNYNKIEISSFECDDKITLRCYQNCSEDFTLEVVKISKFIMEFKSWYIDGNS